MAKRTNLPEDFNVPEIRRKDDSLVTETRTYKVITPLFGGGVEAGVNDPVTPIRGTSVRGQLRFWWRACKGGQFSSVEEMKEREDLIWGSATDADSEKNDRSVLPVSLFVKNDLNSGDKSRYTKYKTLSYAGFSLHNDDSQNLLDNIKFDLILTYSQEFKDDVYAALWAWETFGGIGARTRRGFGCIIRIDNDSRCALPLNEQLKKYVVPSNNKINGIPLLPNKLNESNFAITKAFSDQYRAWERCIKHLKDFRHQSKKTFGSNMWPEPNYIRELNRNDSKTAYSFPRSAFGLPIEFYFIKDSHGLKGKKFTLYPVMESEKQRYASPLILKPIQTGENEYRGIVLRLSGTNVPDKLLLKFPDNPKVVNKNMTPEDASELALKLKCLNGETDILMAFILYVNNEENQNLRGLI